LVDQVILALYASNGLDQVTQGPPVVQRAPLTIAEIQDPTIQIPKQHAQTHRSTAHMWHESRAQALVSRHQTDVGAIDCSQPSAQSDCAPHFDNPPSLEDLEHVSLSASQVA
jgi:hypothetical protein